MTKLINGNQYIVLIRRKDGLWVTRIAYWFEERLHRLQGYEEGFYKSPTAMLQYEKAVCYEEIPKFTTWKLEPPVAGQRYLVYRVGGVRNTPHYTIRKYHHRHGFRSADVKYWIKTSDLATNQITL